MSNERVPVWQSFRQRWEDRIRRVLTPLTPSAETTALTPTPGDSDQTLRDKLVGALVISATAGVGTGTVTSVSVNPANGVTGTVVNPTTAPAISLALGAITPASVAAVGAVSGSNLSGTNTGDQTNVTRSVASVAAMQALTGLASGDVIVTAGYYSAGDGGGATFYYSASSVATTNLGTVFNATGMGTGRFLWNGTGELTVRMFGAKGDDSTDDYAALQGALTFASTDATAGSQYTRKVMLGTGRYAFSSTITVPQSCQLIGNTVNLLSSFSSSVLRYTGNNSKAVRLFFGAQFRDIFIKSQTYQPSTNTGSFGIFIDETSSGSGDSGLTTIDNVWVTGFATSIGSSQICFNNYLDRIHLDGFSRQALSIPGGGTAWKIGAAYIQNLAAAPGVVSTGTITGASIAGSVLTLTMSSLPTYLQVGMYPAISGLSPSGANGFFVVTAISGSGPWTVTCNMPTSPTPITVGTGTLTQNAMPCVGPIVDLGYGDLSYQSLDIEYTVVTGSNDAVLHNNTGSGGLLYLEQVYNTSATPRFVSANYGSVTINTIKTVNMGQRVGVTGVLLRTSGEGTMTVGNATMRDSYRSGAGTTFVLARGDTGVIKPIVGQVTLNSSAHGGDSTFSSTGGYVPMPVPATGNSVRVDSNGALTASGTSLFTGAATFSNSATFAGVSSTPINITATDATPSFNWSRSGSLYASGNLSTYVEMKSQLPATGWRFHGPTATQGVLAVVPLAKVSGTGGDSMTIRSLNYLNVDVATMAFSTSSGGDSLDLGRGQGLPGPQTIAFYATATAGVGSPVLQGSVGVGGWTFLNRIVSTVATGTAPLTVASTTEVANLRSATATALATGGNIGANGTAITRVRHGRATIGAGGVVTVADAYVTANTRIILTVYSVGGTQGFLNTGTRTASTSFTITSSSVLDTSVVDWVAFEP